MQLTIKTRLILGFVVSLSAAFFIFFIGNSNSSQLSDRLNSIVDINSRRLVLALKLSEDRQFMKKREKDL